jgi:uncharacterized membrane protein YphA (DoxX/SURF4 family)
MNEAQSKFAMTALKWTLGLVVLTESLQLALSREAHFFAQNALLHRMRPVIAWSEAMAAVLFLVPYTTRVGAWLLLVIFALAALIHVLHGQMEVGGLLIYAMVVIVVMQSEKKDPEKIVNAV